MSDVFYRDIVIRQGAEFRAEYQRTLARYVHEAIVAGTSGVSAPTFPTALHATVVDSSVTWINRGVWEDEREPDLLPWLPSTAYVRRTRVVTPVEAVNLTNYTGAFQLRSTVDAAATIYAGTVQFGTRANGEFNMVIPTADTDDFTFETASYDLELTTGGGEVDFVVRGTAQLIREVTRP